MSTLNEVLSGLHETDRKLKDKVVDVYSKVGLSAIQDGEQLLNSDNRINPAYNSLKVASIDQTGQDQIKQIKFTGNCKLTFGADGNAILRIGDNLNSSNLGTKDGKTDGTAITAGASGTKITGTPASDMNGSATAIYKGTSYVITTDEFIHVGDNVNDIDAATSGYLTVRVGKNPNQTTETFAFGPFISGTSSYTDDKGSGIVMNILGWDVEANVATGATGYQGKLQLTVPSNVMDALAANADIDFAIQLVTSEGTFNYGPTNSIFKVDSNDYNTVPTIGGISFTVNDYGHTMNSGVDYISSGNVTVNVTNIGNINNPASISNPVTIDPTGGTWFSKTSNKYGNVTNLSLEKTGGDAAATANYSCTFPLVESRIFYRCQC